MTPTDFEAQLRRDGFVELETKSLEPRPANTEHGHPFTIRGLVLDGEFIVTCGGTPRAYRPGEVFEVDDGVPHTEAIGPTGARILIGRKHRAG